MKYETIFSRSFSQYEQKNLGYGLITGSIIIIWSICSIFFYYSYPITVYNFRLLNSGSVTKNGTALNSTQTKAFHQYSTKLINMEIEAKEKQNDSIAGNIERDVKPMTGIKMKRNESIAENKSQEITKTNCVMAGQRASYCEIRGNIRIHGNSSTIFLPTSSSNVEQQSWSIRPYVRQDNAGAMQRVKKWYVNSTVISPACTLHESKPAILFSTGGFSGNTFHDFSDILIPLFLTSKRFNGEVHFLLSDYKPWWVSKFKSIIKQLSNYRIIDIDNDQEVRCYKHLVVGLEFQKELSIDTTRTPNESLSMKDFKIFLRGAFSLKRTKLVKNHNLDEKRSRLMIISRKKSRLFTNEHKIVKMARNVGYNVTVVEARHSTNLSKFAQEVNSCDVLMGVHGAGLTNMVFLPENAVVIQIIPFGKIDGLARKCFKEPAKDMGIKYLEYKIRNEESSLIQEFPTNHAILKDPMSIHKLGWDAVKSTYLDKQNVKLDVRKFRVILLEALKVLHR